MSTRKGTLLGFLIALLIVAPPTWASNRYANDGCRNYGVHAAGYVTTAAIQKYRSRYSTQGFDQKTGNPLPFALPVQDFCQNSNLRSGLAERGVDRLLNKIKQIHEAYALAMGVPFYEIFPLGINIVIQESPRGSHDSFVGDEIQTSLPAVSPDAKTLGDHALIVIGARKESDRIDEVPSVVYAHEFAHLLARSEWVKTHLPYWAELVPLNSLDEGLADGFGFGTTGVPEDGDASFFSRTIALRDPNRQVSYLDHGLLFSDHDFKQRVMNCQGLSGPEIEICQTAITNVNATEAYNRSKNPDYDRLLDLPFDPDANYVYAIHNVFNGMNAFFFEFGATPRDFANWLKAAPTDPRAHQVTAQGKPVASFCGFLSVIRDQVAVTDQARFDLLASKYGVSIGCQYFDRRLREVSAVSTP